MNYFLTLWQRKLAKFGSLMNPEKITSIHPRFLLKLISPKQFKAPSLRPRNEVRQPDGTCLISLRERFELVHHVDITAD